MVHFEFGQNRLTEARPAAKRWKLTWSAESDNLIIRFMKKRSMTVTEAARNFAD